MSQPPSFYADQAAACEKAAAEATLSNQKEKYRQAQAAWQALADTTVRHREEAARRQAESAARRV